MIYRTTISPTYRVTGIIAYLLDDELSIFISLSVDIFR